ncbi:hypothetical protein [Nocardioides solisilvae]|uniref:hypothetical protein n=1 Tax=Nocardioides solisilvae TaxID=1542435 RepID=UPI000D747364|nr:hypothetical protein [Nocardioides solisilvae]
MSWLALVLTAPAALLGGGVVAAAAGPAPGTAPGGDGEVLRLQTATLTSHGPGLPLAGTPVGRQLAGATVRTEVYGMQTGEPKYFPEVDVQLAGVPGTDHDDDARLTVAFGHLVGGTCTPSEHYQRDVTSGRDGSSYRFTGYTPDYWNGTPDRPWDCLYVILGSLDGQTVYDALVGELVNTYESPVVELGDVELLGKKQRQLRLVRGAWTTIDVGLRNTGPIGTLPFEVSGSGRGVQVGKVAVEGVEQGAETAVRLMVRLKGGKGGKKVGPLTLTARGTGVDATRRIKVRSVAPPPRPRAGRYRSSDGRVHFRIRNGRVIGWTGTMQTQCGGYGSVPQYTQNTYDFPKEVKVPRHGIVDASTSGRAAGNTWSASLRMLVKGSKATLGRFHYGTEGPCTASVGFTAKRVGR